MKEPGPEVDRTLARLARIKKGNCAVPSHWFMLAAPKEHTMPAYKNSLPVTDRPTFYRSPTRRAKYTLVITLLCSGVSLVGAQQLVDISSCTRIADDKARIACYDNLARSANAMSPVAGKTAAATPVAPATATAPMTPPAPATASTTTATPTANAAAAVTPAPAKLAAPAAAAGTDATRIAAFGNASQARLEAGAGGQEMLVDTVTALKF